MAVDPRGPWRPRRAAAAAPCWRYTRSARRRFAACGAAVAARGGCRVRRSSASPSHVACGSGPAHGRCDRRHSFSVVHLARSICSSGRRPPQRKNACREGLRQSFVHMQPTLWMTAIIAGLVLWINPASWPASVPVLLLWLISPVVAFLVSQPTASKAAVLDSEDVRLLRRVARKTWAFFETFLGPTDNWLPPDNYQEAPVEKVAHRTSPTNMGLLLLSTLAAHDFGYVDVATLLDATGRDFRHAGQARTLPRPLPELVRHAHSEAAVPAVCFHRGQRQHARLPAHAGAGPDRIVRPSFSPCCRPGRVERRA